MDRKSDGLFRQFKRVAISFADFKEAHDIVSYIKNNKLYADFEGNFLVLSVLTNAMILSYCKPFSGNDSRNKIRVPDLSNTALKVLSPDELSLHKFLIQLRNQLIAHSDSQAIEMKFSVHTYGSFQMLQPVRNRSSRCLSLEQLDIFESMSLKLLSHVATLRKDLEPKIIPLLTKEHIEK
ncbi:hypothetical protein [Vibrio splendidus]|uniref:hypothetical protein n=1 Tax=Vibrio splendidus TaxID=29497 RepID=UPI001112F30C|nr:hypothetical protein [Vibrio splendidus]MDP2590830.1 hypothetical protein [Vibrio splendidus]